MSVLWFSEKPETERETKQLASMEDARYLAQNQRLAQRHFSRRTGDPETDDPAAQKKTKTLLYKYTERKLLILPLLQILHCNYYKDFQIQIQDRVPWRFFKVPGGTGYKKYSTMLKCRETRTTTTKKNCKEIKHRPNRHKEKLGENEPLQREERTSLKMLNNHEDRRKCPQYLSSPTRQTECIQTWREDFLVGNKV